MTKGLQWKTIEDPSVYGYYLENGKEKAYVIRYGEKSWFVTLYRDGKQLNSKELDKEWKNYFQQFSGIKLARAFAKGWIER